MKRSKFSEDQIAFALKQAELGTAVDEVCRKMGISDQTLRPGRRNSPPTAYLVVLRPGNP